MIAKFVSAMIVVASMAFVCGCWAAAQSDKTAMSNEELMKKLTIVLHKFARDNRLSDAELQRLLGTIVLDGPAFRKGGMGKVDDQETYAFLDEAHNAMTIAGQKWVGKESDQYEVVIMNDRHVLGAVDAEHPSNLRIVLFSPQEVRYINLGNNSGGKYMRYPNSNK